MGCGRHGSFTIDINCGACAMSLYGQRLEFDDGTLHGIRRDAYVWFKVYPRADVELVRQPDGSYAPRKMIP